MHMPNLPTVASATLLAAAAVLFPYTTAPRGETDGPAPEPAPGCVFMTVYEGAGLDSAFILKTSSEVLTAEDRGYDWLSRPGTTMAVRSWQPASSRCWTRTPPQYWPPPRW